MENNSILVKYSRIVWRKISISIQTIIADVFGIKRKWQGTIQVCCDIWEGVGHENCQKMYDIVFKLSLYAVDAQMIKTGE